MSGRPNKRRANIMSHNLTDLKTVVEQGVREAFPADEASAKTDAWLLLWKASSSFARRNEGDEFAFADLAIRIYAEAFAKIDPFFAINYLVCLGRLVAAPPECRASEEAKLQLAVEDLKDALDRRAAGDAGAQRR
jgi:hypothetical protein